MTAPILVASSASEPLARHFTSDLDLSTEALTRVLDLAAQMKRTPMRFSQALAGRYLSLLFEKPSLRTRMTFELAIKQLGGDAVDLRGPDRRARAGEGRGTQSGALDAVESWRGCSRRPPSRSWRSGRACR